MNHEQALVLIAQHGYLHGDHYSFNTEEFLQWSAANGEAVSDQEAESLLQQCCQVTGRDAESTLWRYYIR